MIARVLILLLCTWSIAYAQLRVDSTALFMGETLRLQIKSKTNQEIDIKALEQDFLLVQSARGEEVFSDANGIRRSVVRTLYLSPKRPGDLLIPSLLIDGQASEPITIKVSPLENGQGDFFLRLTASAERLYVNQQTVLNLEIWAAQSIRDGSIIDPTHPSVLFEVIDQVNRADPRQTKHRQTQRQFEGKSYTVIERRYLMTPTEAGRLVLEPIHVELLVSSKRRGAFNLGTPLALATEPLTLDVLAIPETAKGWWLPAKSVVFTELDSVPQQLKVGQTWRREFELTAIGAAGSQLPSLTIPAVTNGKIYPTQEPATTQFEDEDLLTKRRYQWSVVPTEAGILVLPELALQWWDVINERMAIARLPERRIEVLTAAGEQVEVSEEAEQAATIEPAKGGDRQSPSQWSMQNLAKYHALLLRVGFSLLGMLSIIAIAFFVRWLYARSAYKQRRVWLKALKAGPRQQQQLHGMLLNKTRALDLDLETQQWMQDFSALLYGGQSEQFSQLHDGAAKVFKAIQQATASTKSSVKPDERWPEL